jgi:hypothetical protein
MMVNLGKAQVFKRHMPQAGHGVIRRNSTAADLLQQFAER